MRKLLPIIVLSTLFVSCAQEVLEPEQQISGMFVLDDGNCFKSEYLSFENGRLSHYSATTSYPFVEGKIWHTDSRAFHLSNKQNYSIREGVLTASGDVSAPAELKDGVLTIGDKRYVALEGFEEAPYSRIVAQNEYVFTYTDQDISIPFTVENPLPGKELKVSLSSSASGGMWITNLAVQEGKITAHISATAEDRTGIIELSYTHAESVTVQIKQQPSTFITIPETSRTVDYTPSTQTLNYTIENPIATSSLTATSSASWINNIQVSTNRISFAVQENNSGSDRNATLTLRYEGARDVTFDVLQRWSASSITLTPSSKEVDYAGGSFTFNYTIVNPREGISVTATSQSNWITNVQLTSSTISYKVAENNSGAPRIGKIKLTYGSYASKEFTVTQSRKPVEGSVDLGLPSGLLWAPCNLGASKPEEYGGYYAWGETTKRVTYSWSEYKWCNGSAETITKYCTNSSYGIVDNITELQRGEKSGETIDDAARAILGGKWRMPTDAEWTELRTRCTWIWTANYNGTGVKGRVVTGTNGNSIFLPAAGVKKGDYRQNAGSVGYFWSSSLYTDGPAAAWYVGINSGGVHRNGNDRYLGFSVRPVCE